MFDIYTQLHKKRENFKIKILSWKRPKLESKWPKYVIYVPELHLLNKLWIYIDLRLLYQYKFIKGKSGHDWVICLE